MRDRALHRRAVGFEAAEELRIAALHELIESSGKISKPRVIVQIGVAEIVDAEVHCGFQQSALDGDSANVNRLRHSRVCDSGGVSQLDVTHSVDRVVCGCRSDRAELLFPDFERRIQCRSTRHQKANFWRSQCPVPRASAEERTFSLGTGHRALGTLAGATASTQACSRRGNATQIASAIAAMSTITPLTMRSM